MAEIKIRERCLLFLTLAALLSELIMKTMRSIVSFALLLLPQVYALVATNAAFVRRSVVKYTDQVRKDE